MINHHTKASFVVAETPQEPGDHGDNEWHAYDIVLKVKAQSEKAKHIERLHVASAQIRFGAPEGNPKKHPQLSKYLDISKGDLLIAEYYPPTSENGYGDLLQKPCIISLGLVKNKTFRRLRGIPLEWLFTEMLATAKRNGIPLQTADTWVHSSHVYQYAFEIAEKALMERVANHMGKLYTNDFKYGLAGHILEKASFAHDFGRMFTGSNASRNLEDGILHGYRGAKHFRKLASKRGFRDAADELELLARVCERHIGGAGLTESSLARHPAFVKLNAASSDILAESPYEKIIGYADWRTHSRENGTVFFPTWVSKSIAMERTKKYNPPADQLLAVESLCSYIHDITDGQIAT